MTYLTPADSIESAPLSVRSHNALRRAEIHTVSQLLACDRKKLSEIRNLGAKSLDEICDFMASLSSATGEFRLFSGDSESPDTEAGAMPEPIAVFRDSGGQLRKDIALEKLDLSVRSYHCLHKAGYEYASQLIGLTEASLLAIKNLGMTSAAEILAITEKLVFPKAESGEASSGENALCQAFVSEITKLLPIHGGLLYQELLPIYERAGDTAGTIDAKDLYAAETLREAVKQKILAFLSGLPFGAERAEVMSLLPEALIEHAVMSRIIAEMESDGQIIIGSRIERRRMTILEYARSIQKKNEREFLIERLQGLTLEEIGGAHSVTRERVRQVIKKALRGRPVVAEDQYVSVFTKYDFSKRDFSLAFGESEVVYNYLTLVCDKRGSHFIGELLEDEAFPREIRQKAEKAVYKNYITVGGERIYKDRAKIADYVARTYFQNEASFDDFTAYYNMLLEDLGLSEDANLTINARSYENKLGEYDKVLWSRGRKFRYYNIDSYDFTEFWKELALHQYKNVEYSARKFFRDYPELMRRYDIRDEYELHNLLKKLCLKNKTDNIGFHRMPMLEFGNANRDEQVLDMLIRLAPVTIQALAAAYEAEYGVLQGTFMAGFLKNFSEYFHNGIYDISAAPLPGEQFARMSAILTEDYYEISDVKRLYLREFPEESAGNINSYTLKTLGFNVFASYVIKKACRSASEYFRALLTRDDLVDTRGFPAGLTGKSSYSSELYALKSRYEIIEYEPLRYINIRRLKSAGITVSHLKDYCGAVAGYVGIGEYFTVQALKNSGFSHSLDDLGFGDVFYSSLLSEDPGCFSYQHMGGVKMFRRGVKEISLRGFIESVIEREVSINIYELTQLFAEWYGVHIDRYKLVEAVKNSSLYYDSIMEKVYIDYDTYFEEV